MQKGCASEESRKTSISLIAEKSGYSISTCSRVLNGKGKESRISAEASEKIKKVAESLGYYPDIFAQNLRRSSTQTIGLVVPGLANPYFAAIASVVITQARQLGFNTIVSDTMDDASLQNESVSTLASRKVDGLIVVPSGSDSTFLEQIDEKYVPIILIDRYFHDTKLPYVATNNYRGGYDGTNILIKNGHRRIVCLRGLPQATTTIDRIAGYKDAMRDAGLEDEIYIVGNDYSIQNGYLESKLLLCSNSRPTAVFALSNTIALGVVEAVNEAGLSIPDDLSLVGFDNNTYLDYMNPPMTRIGQRVEEMGKMAVKLLFDRMVYGRKVRNQIELSPEVIIRKSVIYNLEGVD